MRQDTHEIASRVADEWRSRESVPAPDQLCDHQVQLSTISRKIAQNMFGHKELLALADLTETIHLSMRRCSHDALFMCRRMYTDVSIIQSLAEASVGQHEKAVNSLDRALIISGDLNHELVQRLIAEYQLALPSPKDKWLEDTPLLAGPSLTSPSEQTRPSAALHIPTIEAPSLSAFQSRWLRTPFIVSGYAMRWPALKERPWRRAAYLRSVAGPGRMVPVEIGNHYLAEEWTQRIMSWDNFLSMLTFEDQPPQIRPDARYYLAQHNLFVQFPRLRYDIITPDYTYACLDCDYPGYQSPANDDGIILNTWLGPENTVSPAHTDPFNNLYVQVSGRKTVWLAPPSTAKTMVTNSKGSLSNTSAHNVFSEIEDSAFCTNVFPEAMSATLEPGDLLYIPVGWWHAMRSESTSFSVSHWF